MRAQLRPVAWAAVAMGCAASAVLATQPHALPTGRGSGSPARAAGGWRADRVEVVGAWFTPTARVPSGVRLPASSRYGRSPVQLARPAAAYGQVAPLSRLHPADLLAIAPARLPAGAVTAVRRLPGVVAAEPLDAARLSVGGHLVPVLGVDPSGFRAFSAAPVARSSGLWQAVAAGRIVVSFQMGRQLRLPLGGPVTVLGRTAERLRVGGFGTVGIAGAEAVVSRPVAHSLGLPDGNAIVVSAPHARLAGLIRRVTRVLPHGASVVPLVSQAPAREAGPAARSGAGMAGWVSAETTAARGTGLSAVQLTAFLRALVSRVGMPYVWGAAGPSAFDCSGLVQWSLARAGVVMPRVAADQARTGPRVPVVDLRPGDLLFWRTDPTAPNYISHVAVYLGHGLMIQAPEPGKDVQIVPVVFGSNFAGAIRVIPRVAAQVAAGGT